MREVRGGLEAMKFALAIFGTICLVNVTAAANPLEALSHAVAGFVVGMLAAVVLQEWGKRHGVRP